MKRLATTCVVIGVLLGMSAAVRAEAPAPPENRVLVMYFHRTERCPTCLKMGAYTEEAVKTAFARELKEGTVELRDIDFQDQRNAAVAKGFKITGPALVVARITANKLKEHKDLQEIWMKVREKPEFVQYVREQVDVYLPARADSPDVGETGVGSSQR